MCTWVASEYMAHQPTNWFEVHLSPFYKLWPYSGRTPLPPPRRGVTHSLSPASAHESRTPIRGVSFFLNLTSPNLNPPAFFPPIRSPPQHPLKIPLTSNLPSPISSPLKPPQESNSSPSTSSAQGIAPCAPSTWTVLAAARFAQRTARSTPRPVATTTAYAPTNVSPAAVVSTTRSTCEAGMCCCCCCCCWPPFLFSEGVVVLFLLWGVEEEEGEEGEE